MAFTEELMLPSRGVIYQKTDFDGVVRVKPFTTKNYKDLLASNASEAGLKQFIDQCLVDCPIKAKDMHQEDLLAILLKTRVMTLGNNLKMEVKCPECNKLESLDWDLTNIDINYLYIEKYPIPVTLPVSEKEIKVRFPTGYDSRKAKQEAEKRASTFKKDASEFTQLFGIVSLIDVDGKDIIEKADWYENLDPRDAIFINEIFAEMNNVFGVKMTKTVRCSACDKEYNTYIDISSDFFRSSKHVSLGITSKAGNLAGVIEKPNISE